MSTNPALQLIMGKIEALVDERDDLLRRASAIDDQIAAVAQGLGITNSEIAGLRAPTTRLVAEDKRSEGTMSAKMLDILYTAEKGYSRSALRGELAETPRFGEQISNNVNSYYNNIARYLKKGKIVDVNGLLYHPDRAPIEGAGEGGRLPENVTLFTGKRARDDA